VKIQAVIGANYGDEGKGLVSGCLAREASLSNEKVLTVFYNGTSQRAHTFEGEVHRCMAAGTKYGSDTYYHHRFVVDPISLLITQATPIIDPMCRVILPCDVITNRKKERERGNERHGSCGFGLYEAVQRSKQGGRYDIRIKDLVDHEQALMPKLLAVEKKYGPFVDEIYNAEMLLAARQWIMKHCKIRYIYELIQEKNYDRMIFEGGQGLMLSQNNIDSYPHLTPSCTGSDYIHDLAYHLSDYAAGENPELFYVSRSYATRHGAGPMEAECEKAEINPDIVDTTNGENEFQGALRFGKLDLDHLYGRIKDDASLFRIDPKINLVFTQLNYTDGKLDTVNGREDIVIPEFASGVYVSDQKDRMEKL